VLEVHSGAASRMSRRPHGRLVSDGTTKPDTFERCPSKDRSAKICPPHVGVLKSGEAEVGTTQIGASQVGVPRLDVIQLCLSKLRIGQMRAPEPRSRREDPVEPCPFGERPAQIRLIEPCRAQICIREIGVDGDDSHHRRVAETRSPQDSRSQDSTIEHGHPGQDHPGHVRVREVRSSQVRAPHILPRQVDPRQLLTAQVDAGERRLHDEREAQFLPSVAAFGLRLCLSHAPVLSLLQFELRGTDGDRHQYADK
jgi:hypothetical protein